MNISQMQKETYDGMEPSQWYYMVGKKFSKDMDKLVEAGLLESSMGNPIGKWPMYRRKKEALEKKE